MPAPQTAPASPYRFQLGSWTVDPRAGELLRGTEAHRLEPKVMGVLAHLAAHAGEVVSRDELLDAVWPDVVVTENALSRCISDLRRALGDDPRKPALIETIPKTGYRLLVPALPLDAGVSLLSGDGVPDLTDVQEPTSPLPAPADPPRAARRQVAGALFVVLAVLGVALLWPRARPLPTVTSLQPITTQPGSEGLATLSPSGDRIVYVRFRDRSQTGYLETVGANGGTAVRLTEGGTDTFPSFSPDGQRIAFLRCSGTRCQPYSISALGRDERPLGDIWAHASGLSWSPDGRLIAYVASAEGAPLHLAVLDVATGTQRRLTTPPPTGLGDVFPAFSPDGSALAFVRRTDETKGDIHVVPLEGGAPRRLSSDRSQVARLSWFPDGRSLLAASDRDGPFRLWRYSTEGAAPTPLPVEAAMPIGPALGTHGARLLVETWDMPIQLWRYDLGTPDAARAPVAASTRWDRMPSLSPDAQQAVFVSTRSGHAELWTAPLNGGLPRQLTTLGSASVRSPQWSPDGDRIAFVARHEGQYDLFTIPVAGGIPTRVSDTTGDETNPRWSADGRFLFVGRRDEDRWVGTRLDADTGVETTVVPDAAVLAPSMDGHTLWFTLDSRAGIWSLPLDARGEVAEDSEPALRIPDLTTEDAARWAVVDDGLLYFRRTDGRESLARWTESGTQTVLDGPLGLDLWAPALAVSPDGATVVVAQLEPPEIDILLAQLDAP